MQEEFKVLEKIDLSQIEARKCDPKKVKEYYEDEEEYLERNLFKSPSIHF